MASQDKGEGARPSWSELHDWQSWSATSQAAMKNGSRQEIYDCALALISGWDDAEARTQWASSHELLALAVRLLSVALGTSRPLRRRADYEIRYYGIFVVVDGLR